MGNELLLHEHYALQKLFCKVFAVEGVDGFLEGYGLGEHNDSPSFKCQITKQRDCMIEARRDCTQNLVDGDFVGPLNCFEDDKLSVGPRASRGISGSCNSQ